MVSTSAQPPYLVSATNLIKALKSARDPPQADWPSKIEIATQAWHRKDSIGHGLGGRVGDVIREWLLESWVKSKGAKGAKNELLNAAYHDLLRSIILETPAIGVSTTQSHQFLTAFLLALRTSPELATEQLLLSASNLFNTLFGHKSAIPTAKQGGISTNGILVKAESWLETLGGLIALYSHIVDLSQAANGTGKLSTMHLDLEQSQGLLALARLIVVETNASLVISQTRRKITLNLIKPLVPTYLKVLHALPLVKEPLETLVGPLFWPLAVLQPQTQSSQASSSESAQEPAETVIRELVFPINGQKSSSPQETLSTLSFIPALSKEYVAALQANRYAIFPPPSASANARSKIGSTIPPDVYVGDKVRESVRGYMQIVLQCVADIEQGLSAGPQGDATGTKDSSARNVQLELWRTRFALWTVVKQWGGYFEGDADWRQLVTETVSVCARWLSTTGFKMVFGTGHVESSTDAPKSKRKSISLPTGNVTETEIYGCIEQLFSALLELDFGACKVDVDDEGRMVLAASLLNDTASPASGVSSPIEVVLRYHTLTQSIPAFAELLIAAIQYGFTSSFLTILSQRDIYRRLASGPLVSPEFRTSFEKALNGTFVGGISEERGWGNVVTLLGAALRDSTTQLRTEGAKQSLEQPQSEAPSKRRRKNDGSSAPVASNTGTLPIGAGTFGIVSRLLATALCTAYGKGQGYEKFGKAEDVLRIVDSVAAAWRETAASTASEEVASGVLRLRKAEELLRREIVAGQAVPVQGRGEAFFEQANLQLQTWSIIGQSSGQAVSALIEGLAAVEASLAWSGKVVDVTKGTSAAALWHIVAQRGLTAIEEHASKEELDTFAITLLSDIFTPTLIKTNDHSRSSSLLKAQAIERMLTSAEFWELARIRFAILGGIQHVINDNTSSNMINIFSLLLQAPSDFLTKAVRTAAVKRAYEIDAAASKPGSSGPLSASESEIIRRFMVKVLKDTEHLGPLADGNVLMRFTLEKASSTEGVESATRELISIAVNALVKDSRSPKSQDALKLLITTAQQRLDNTDHKRLFNAILQLFQSAVEQSASLSPDISSQLTPLSQSILSMFTSSLRSLDPTLFVSEQGDILQRVGILSAVTRYCAQSSLKVDHGDLANTLCVQALKTWNQSSVHEGDTAPREEAACDLLKWVISQSDPSANVVDMKSFFAMWSAFAALLGQSHVLESLLCDVFASASGPVFEALLTLLASTLERELEDAKGLLVPALRALAVVSALSIQHTGRIYRSTLARILSALKRLVQRSRSAQVHLECLRLIEVIASEKTVILVHQDVSDMLAICYTATLPPSSKVSVSGQAVSREHNATHPHLAALLSTVSTLVRHRRDLVINVLPQLVKLYARLFGLFGLPRQRSTVGGSEERVKRIVKREWPVWLAAEGAAHGLGEEDARAFARALVTLTSRTIIRTTSASSTASAGTMIGQLSKHAPVLLIAYVRAVAHPLSTIPPSSRHELVPGIGAMCEAVVAGGKAMLGGAGSASGSGGASENRTAESVGEAFGLGEGSGGDGELIVWGEMWRAWRRSRYVGQG